MKKMPDPPIRIGAVTLTVRDLEKVSAFYREAIGLQTMAEDAGTIHLGAGGKELLTLREDTDARERSSRGAGLFHTAFLLPERPDLARWAIHARNLNLTVQGASDHHVSEALYLADPEGNGIEIYADRPAEGWTWNGDRIAMRTDPLDWADLMQSAGSGTWRGCPDDTTIGHVHLQVGAIEPAEAFIGDILGLAPTATYPGASFFGSGGYHHHLAGNIWNSRGAPEVTAPSHEPMTGLAEVELLTADAATSGAIRDRAVDAGVAVKESEDGLVLQDPWGTAFRVGSAAG